MNNWIKLYDLISQHLKARERLLIGATIGCTLVAAGCLAISPFVLGKLTDSLLASRDGRGDRVILLASIYLFVIAAPKIINTIVLYLQSTLRLRANQSLLGSYFNYLCDQPENFFTQRNPGELSQEINQASNDLFVIIRNISFSIISPTIQIGIAFLVLATSKNTSVALVILIYIALFLVNNVAHGKRLIQLKSGFMTAGRKSYATLTDSISNISIARQYNAYGLLLSRYQNVLNEDQQAQGKYWKVTVRMQLINALLFVGLFGASFVLALHEVLHNGRSVGNFVLIGAYTLTLLSPIESLGNMFTEINQSLQTFGGFIDKISASRRVPRIIRGAIDSDRKAIEFDRVSLTYPDNQIPVLHEISFSIKCGQCAVITGPSGAGKSSIVRALTKQYAPHQGSIRVYGCDVSNIDPYTLNEKIGLVSQDVFAFKDTLRFNLLVAKPSASDSELLSALDKAELREYLGGLQDGLDTVLGDRGATLSGGQRQRLALARLFLRDPDIVVLDEGTSSLDVITERRVLDQIGKTFRGKTVVIVTHRPTAMSMADTIIVVSDGRIDDIGQMEDLRLRNAFFSRVMEVEAR